MDLDDSQQKAFDFVADYTKQLITIATALIAFMVTFLNDVLKGDAIFPKLLLILSWLFYILSIGAGIMRLMALTGNLDPLPKDGKKPDVNPTITSTNIRYTGLGQIILFLLGILFTGIFGCYQLFSAKASDQGKEKSLIVVKETIIGKDTTIKSDTFYLKEIPLKKPN